MARTLSAPVHRSAAPVLGPHTGVMLDPARVARAGDYVVARVGGLPEVLPAEMADPAAVVGVVAAVHHDRPQRPET